MPLGSTGRPRSQVLSLELRVLLLAMIPSTGSDLWRVPTLVAIPFYHHRRNFVERKGYHCPYWDQDAVMHDHSDLLDQYLSRV